MIYCSLSGQDLFISFSTDNHHNLSVCCIKLFVTVIPCTYALLVKDALLRSCYFLKWEGKKIKKKRERLTYFHLFKRLVRIMRFAIQHQFTCELVRIVSFALLLSFCQLKACKWVFEFFRRGTYYRSTDLTMLVFNLVKCSNPVHNKSVNFNCRLSSLKRTLQTTAKELNCWPPHCWTYHDTVHFSSLSPCRLDIVYVMTKKHRNTSKMKLNIP